MAYAPENTLAAFERAAQLGAEWVELDIHLSRDGAAVVIHDETLERTTDGSGLVKDHDLAELKRLDAGAWFGPEFAGQRIPTLDEVLDWAAARGVVLDLEIKNGPIFYAGIEQSVVAAVQRHGLVERTLVSSFDHWAVRRVHQLEPRIATGVLYTGRPVEPAQLARQVEADVLLPHWSLLCESDVGAAHAAGLGVIPWASSEPATLAWLAGLGVQAIISNHPDVLVEALRSR